MFTKLMLARQLLSYKEFHENRINAEARYDRRMDVVSTYGVDRTSLRRPNIQLLNTAAWQAAATVAQSPTLSHSSVR